jgi:hypothetical protein
VPAAAPARLTRTRHKAAAAAADTHAPQALRAPRSNNNAPHAAAAMEVDGASEGELDRAFDVLERLRECGLAPAALTDETPLLEGRAPGAELRAAAASLAAAAAALPAGLLAPAGALDAPVAAVAAAAADDGAAGGGRLESALAALLRACDAEAEPLTCRLDLFGAHAPCCAARVQTPLPRRAACTAPCVAVRPNKQP